MNWQSIGVQRAAVAIYEAMQFTSLPAAITFLNQKIATFELLDPDVYTTAIACLRAQVSEWEKIRLKAIIAG